MVFEILAAVITLVIIVLVFYLIKMLKDVQSFLQTSKTSIQKIQCEIELMNSEINPLVRESSELIHKVNTQIGEFDPLMKSIHNIGNFLNEATEHKLPSLEKKTSWQEKTAEMLVLTSMAIKLLEQFQKRR